MVCPPKRSDLPMKAASDCIDDVLPAPVGPTRSTGSPWATPIANDSRVASDERAGAYKEETLSNALSPENLFHTCRAR